MYAINDPATGVWVAGYGENEARAKQELIDRYGPDVLDLLDRADRNIRAEVSAAATIVSPTRLPEPDQPVDASPGGTPAATCAVCGVGILDTRQARDTITNRGRPLCEEHQ